VPEVEQIYRQAVAALQQGALETAEQHFKSVLAEQPGHRGALNLLGMVLLRLGKANEAEGYLRQAIGGGSNADPATLYNYALVLRNLGRSSDALASVDDALAVTPDDAELWTFRGMLLNDLGRYEEAVSIFDKVVALRPDLLPAQYNRAKSLVLVKRYDEALSVCDHTLALKPDFPLAWFGRSQILKEVGRHEESLAAFEKYALLTTPHDLPRRSDIIALATDLFSFDLLPFIYPDQAAVAAERERLEALIGTIERRLEALDDLPGPPAVVLNAVFCVAGFNIGYQQKNDVILNRRYADVLQRILRIQNARLRPWSGAKIRFGIASALLRDHNASRFALEWLAQLPREDYSFFVYALNADLDEVSRKFAALGQFRQLVFNEATMFDVIAYMQNDQLDILMLPDVGMTPASRVLSQFRVAPVQCCGWGHPVTTGAPNIDFFLSRDLMEPPDAQSHYSETLVRLPNLAAYIRPSSYPVDDGLPFELPENRVLYGCLQSLFKYLPQFDFVFPQIAARLPQSCFLFIEGNPESMTGAFRSRLQVAFGRDGLDFEHFVRFLPRMSGAQFGGLLRRIHVSIDSIGWTGDNTTIQALEANCPLATLPTAFMRGRHSYGILKMMGVDELIAKTTEEFVDILVRLGADAEFRTAMGRRIAQSKHRLYEDRDFVAALDTFLKSHRAAIDKPDFAQPDLTASSRVDPKTPKL
jgi:predicted O-linked N-acetylglucosamine transferase (SPINDLY family)